MKPQILIGAAVAAGALIVLGQSGVGAGVKEQTPTAAPASFEVVPLGDPSPDVITGDLPATVRWETDATETAYSIATTSCNIGDYDLDWVASPSDRHPVIAQNLYRLKDGRFEHIGMSWLKHSFCALQLFLTGCGECEGPGGCLSRLTPGCADPYSATRNGSQGGLGPKWQVNAHTGEFAVPWDPGEGTGGDFRRRIRVLNTDLDPALNEDALYFVEGHYVAKDDAAAGNQNNNASYRRVTVNPINYNLSVVDQTQQQKQAIRAWQDFDEDVTLEEVQVPDDGLLILGSKVTDNDDGTWDYEYALYNMNSDRSAGSFSVPVGSGASVLSTGFHDIDYHSGEAWDSTDWPLPATGTGLTDVTWSTEPYAANEQANAVRWGTVYNFRFTADSAPTPVTATIGLFKPGTPSSMTVTTMGPSESGGGCLGDLDGSGTIGFFDLVQLISVWGACPGCPEDLDGNGTVGFTDLLQLISTWGPCP